MDVMNAPAGEVTKLYGTSMTCVAIYSYAKTMISNAEWMDEDGMEVK
jgi:hypothetical protein